MSTIDITDPGSGAWYAGAAMGSEIRKAIDEQYPKDATSDMRLAAFWLEVGRRIDEFPNEREQEQFLAGVGTSGVQRRGVWLEFSTSGPTFHQHDEEAADYDYETDDRDFRRAITVALMQVVHTVTDGLDRGDIRESNGRVIGRWVIND